MTVDLDITIGDDGERRYQGRSCDRVLAEYDAPCAGTTSWREYSASGTSRAGSRQGAWRFELEHATGAVHVATIEFADDVEIARTRGPGWPFVPDADDLEEFVRMTSGAANHDKIRQMIVSVLECAHTPGDVERWVAERVDVDGRLYVIRALRHAFGLGLLEVRVRFGL